MESGLSSTEEVSGDMRCRKAKGDVQQKALAFANQSCQLQLNAGLFVCL